MTLKEIAAMGIDMFMPVRPPAAGPFCGVVARVNGVDHGYLTHEIVGEVQYFIDAKPVTKEAYERAVKDGKDLGASLP